MNILSKTIYNQIRSWVYRHARHLDLTIWQYHFENGSADAVIEALSFYQNEDGGFGKGLEPDNSNPNSFPYATDMAYRILESIGIDHKEHPMIQGIIRYIENSDHFTEQGWLWAIPSNNHYPCMPWYKFPNAPWFPAGWPPENFTNSAMFRLALRYFPGGHEIYQKTLRVMDHRLALMPKFADFCTFAKSQPEQSIEANDWVLLIELLKEYEIKNSAECERLASDFMQIVNAAAIEEVRREIQKRIEIKGAGSDELDLLVDQLGQDKVWLENGLWCDTPDEKKDLVSFVSMLWWPIMDVIGDLKRLKEHGRLDESKDC